MIPSKKFQDNFALAIIALMLKREEILNQDDENIRKRFVEEFEIQVHAIDKGLEYLREIGDKFKKEKDKNGDKTN